MTFSTEILSQGPLWYLEEHKAGHIIWMKEPLTDVPNSSQSSRSMECKSRYGSYFLSSHLLSAYSIQNILNLFTLFSLTCELPRLLFQFPNTQAGKYLSLLLSLSPSPFVICYWILGSWREMVFFFKAFLWKF